MIEQLFRSYLMAYLFWFGIALGCLPLLMLHHLVGGTWGFVIRRILEAGTRTLPLMLVLFLPLIFGVHSLYEWSHPDVVARDQALQAKQAYLNVPFFIVRTVIYFLLWLTFAFLLNRWSAQQDATGDPRLIRRFQLLSGPGIVVYSLTITFASIDWGMSLEPRWFSTIYGMLFIVGQTLAALAFVIPVAGLLSESPPVSEVLNSAVFQDLGNLLLAFVMLWAYISFSQYLIIWSGNLPEEIPWYLHRGTNGWQWVAAVLALFHFAVPFLLLLGRGNKRNKRFLGGIAIAVLLMRWVDLYWLIAPSFLPRVRIHLFDVVLFAAIGAIWLYVFLGHLNRRALLPLRDPNFVVETAA
ncbi:MAG: hypothetical protein DMG14_30910 [Acidobacteria bacterium]|nr:MAG: hypothetical protein DMG14_30910 [Acidobacteriota bacterium]